MKKIIFVLLALFLFLFLVSCNVLDEGETNSKKDLERLESSSVYVFVDPETGVNYLIYAAGYKGGICVRYNSDGSVFVSEE